MDRGFTGVIKTWDSQKQCGFIRADQSIADSWFSRDAFESKPELLVAGTRVQFHLLDYVTRAGVKRTKGVHVKPLPAEPELPPTLSLNDVLSKESPDAKPYVPPIRPNNVSVLAEEAPPQKNF